MRIDTVVDALNLLNLDQIVKREIVAKVEELVNEEKAEKAATREKKSKREFVICLKSPEDLSKYEIVGTVLSLKEGEDVTTAVDKFRQCAVSHNLAQRKKNKMVQVFSDALSFVKNKFLKEQDIKRVAGKDWVAVVQVPENLVEELPEI